MIINEEKMNWINMAGLVFMYGSCEVVTSDRDEKTIVEVLKGANGYSSEVINEVTYKADVFQELKKKLANIDFDVTEQAEAGYYLISEDVVDYDASKEWVIQVGKDEEVICEIRGCNNNSVVFNNLCSAFVEVVKEYSEILDFFENV